MYESSVPVFTRYLGQLAALVTLAERHQLETGLAVGDARLAADMLPFSEQVEIAAHFALRGCFPLAGLAVPDYGEFPSGFAGLQARIERARCLLAALPADAFGDSGRLIAFEAGQAQLILPAREFLQQFALPNFFFHLSMAYALLRQLGAELGKAAFDGYHRYPPHAFRPQA